MTVLSGFAFASWTETTSHSWMQVQIQERPSLLQIPYMVYWELRFSFCFRLVCLGLMSYEGCYLIGWTPTAPFCLKGRISFFHPRRKAFRGPLLLGFLSGSLLFKVWSHLGYYGSLWQPGKCIHLATFRFC